MKLHGTSFSIIIGILMACQAPVSEQGPEPGQEGYIPPGWTEPILAYPGDAYTPESVKLVSLSPGQWVKSEYSLESSEMEQRLLGYPQGMGVYGSDSSSSVSLGMAGGAVQFYFDPPIENHPLNLKGYDFIIYGNAFWNGGDPLSGSFEPAVVEVMTDENANGQPDESWLLIQPPGWPLPSPRTSSLEYRISGSAGSPTALHWDVALNSQWSGTFEPLEEPGSFSHNLSLWWKESWGTSLIITEAWIWPPELKDLQKSQANYYACGDAAPTRVLGDLDGDDNTRGPADYPGLNPVFFYTVPDQQGDNALDNHSGGGNAIDLEWAIDPQRGISQVPQKISWIRLSSATLDIHPLLGEGSPEIDAVVRVLRGNE